MANNEYITLKKDLLPHRIGNIFLLSLIFIIYPFAGCILGFYLLSCGKNNVLPYFLIIAFAFLYGYSVLPYSNDDIVRHYGFFEEISLIDSLPAFFAYMALMNQPDFGIEIIYWVIGRFSNEHQLVGAIGASLYYGFLLAIICKWIILFPNVNYKRSLILTCLALLSLIPSNEFCGMRQGLANAIFIYLLLVLPYSKKTNMVKAILLIIPCIIHFSTIPYILIYWLSAKLRNKTVVKTAIVLAVLGLVIVPLMSVISGLISKLGFIGAGIAIKIDGYMFSGELENELYSGSRLRFYMLLMFVFIFPFIIKKIGILSTDKHRIKPIIIRFFILFFGYLIFSCQTFILSRTLMLFKIILCLCLSLLAFNKKYPYITNKKFQRVLLFVSFAGILFFFQAMEYRVVNPAIFYSSLPSILSITTDPAGYPI